MDLAFRAALDSWIDTHNGNARVSVQIVAPRPADDDRPRTVNATE